jgi:hypothetical protein
VSALDSVTASRGAGDALAGASAASGASEASGASGASSPEPALPPASVGFCFRAYASVRPRVIFEALGVCFALAMSFRCHANAPWRK